jgi:hypothetical protein
MRKGKGKGINKAHNDSPSGILGTKTNPLKPQNQTT